MDASTFQLVRTGGLALALAAALAVQRWRPHAGRGGSARVNLGLWAIDLAMTSAVCGTCAWSVAVWAEGAGVGLLRLAALPGWLMVGASVLALDGVSYWWHRANHRLGWLWRFHGVHHTDPTLTVTTALRFHPGEIALSLPVRLAAVTAIGAPATGVLVFELAFALANLVEHGDVALPTPVDRGLARVVVTPALHRRHHDEVTANRNRNFGTILTLWDRAFGTYGASATNDRWTIGAPEVGVPTTVRAALVLPFRARGTRSG